MRLGRCKKGLTVSDIFHCQISLVETFEALYVDRLVHEGSRAIVFPCEFSIPSVIVGDCISLASNYHRVNKLPFLRYPV